MKITGVDVWKIEDAFLRKGWKCVYFFSDDADSGFDILMPNEMAQDLVVGQMYSVEIKPEEKE